MVREREIGSAFGPRLLKDLTVDDSWVKTTYGKVARAGREFARANMDIRDTVAFTNALQRDILQDLPIVDVSSRPVCETHVQELADFIAEEKGGLVVMRHGIQFIEDEERRLLAGSSKKIRLMQPPFNDQDPADAQSLAEAASLALILMHIGKQQNIPVLVKTSRNKRAAEIGAIISVVNGFQVAIDDRLTCVNYPTDKTDDELEELLGRDNMGALVWKKEILNSICGDGTFETIDLDMRDFLGQFIGENQLVIAITHTPQTNSVDVISGDVPIRMPELGFRVINSLRSQRFIENIFSM